MFLNLPGDRIDKEYFKYLLKKPSTMAYSKAFHK